MVSFAHNVAPKGKYLAIVSSVVESAAGPEQELAAGLKYIGPTLKTYSSFPQHNQNSVCIECSVGVLAQ